MRESFETEQTDDRMVAIANANHTRRKAWQVGIPSLLLAAAGIGALAYNVIGLGQIDGYFQLTDQNNQVQGYLTSSFAKFHDNFLEHFKQTIASAMNWTLTRITDSGAIDAIEASGEQFRYLGSVSVNKAYENALYTTVKSESFNKLQSALTQAGGKVLTYPRDGSAAYVLTLVLGVIATSVGLTLLGCYTPCLIKNARFWQKRANELNPQTQSLLAASAPRAVGPQKTDEQGVDEPRRIELSCV